MGEKIFKTGIKRDGELMYYIKDGDVWATPRKKPGQPKGKAQKVARAGIEMDYSRYLYYLDADGDVARRERQVGGSNRLVRRVGGTVEDDDVEDDDVEGEDDDVEADVKASADQRQGAVASFEGGGTITANGTVQGSPTAGLNQEERVAEDLSTATGVGSALNARSGAGTAAGTSTATAVGASIAVGIGTAAGTSTAQAVAESVQVPGVTVLPLATNASATVAEQPEEGRSGSSTRLTRDAPGEKACLKADEYALALADVIVSAPGEFCFALLGHWGRGKTYLAKLVGQKLPAQYDRIWFSAWKYRSRPELWAHLHESFYAELMRAAWWRRVPRLFRANLHKHGVAPLVWMFIGAGIAAVPLGSLLQLAVVLLGAIGAIRGALLFFKQRTPITATLRRFLAVNRHTEKLGLQAAIGVDLESLVIGWAGQLQWSGVRIFLSVAGYVFGVAALIGGLWLGFHPTPTLPIPRLPWLTWYPLPVVSWTALAVVAGFAVVVLPVWLLAFGREKNRLLLIVDDLDRMPSDEMLEIVESLKLFLENGTMREAVQLFLICEEEALRRALADKYGRKTRAVEENLRAVEENLRAVEENLQKLFIAHLRLPPLESSEQEEVLRNFIGAVADPAPQVTDTATATAASPGPARVAAPSGPAATAVDAPEYTDDDQRALLKGLRILGGRNSTWAALGPRAIQSYVLRYKLARRLLVARGARVLPERLAVLLAERMHAGSDGAPEDSEVIHAVIAEVA